VHRNVQFAVGGRLAISLDDGKRAAFAISGLITALNLTQCLRDARRFRAEIEFNGHHYRLGDFQGGQRFNRALRRGRWGRALLATS
jgi:hypothetical protein